MNNKPSQGDVLIYQNEKGDTKVDVYYINDTVWMTQKQIAALYDKSVKTISMHIKNIYDDEELFTKSTFQYHEIVQSEGTRAISRKINLYNLDMILAIGYRVRSSVGNQFRNWASSILKEYMKKGFAMNDERLKNPERFGQDYFDELLERIRDIRASEKRFYQKVRDIYALAVDYNKDATETKNFFANVQNKLLYSVTGMTAAELIVHRASADKDNMGLTSFKGAVVRKADIEIAKNYLQEDELSNLNRIVTMFLDFAEEKAKNNQAMTMSNWRSALDGFLTFYDKKILHGQGNVSHNDMKVLVNAEFEKYKCRRLNMPDEQPIVLSVLPVTSATKHK